MFDINGNIATNNSTHFFFVKNKTVLPQQENIVLQELQDRKL